MMGWQPIETAPVNGTLILMVRGAAIFVGRFDPHHQCWLTMPGLYRRSPTHWQPLPGLPTQTQPESTATRGE